MFFNQVTNLYVYEIQTESFKWNIYQKCCRIIAKEEISTINYVG